MAGRSCSAWQAWIPALRAPCARPGPPSLTGWVTGSGSRGFQGWRHADPRQCVRAVQNHTLQTRKRRSREDTGAIHQWRGAFGEAGQSDGPLFRVRGRATRLIVAGLARRHRHRAGRLGHHGCGGEARQQQGHHGKARNQASDARKPHGLNIAFDRTGRNTRRRTAPARQSTRSFHLPPPVKPAFCLRPEDEWEPDFPGRLAGPSWHDGKDLGSGVWPGVRSMAVAGARAARMGHLGVARGALRINERRPTARTEMRGL